MSFQSILSLVTELTSALGIRSRSRELATLGLLGILVACLCSCKRSEPESFGPSNTRLVSTRTPEQLTPTFELSERLDPSLSRTENWFPIVSRELNDLSKSINATIDKTISSGTFEAPSLKYSGVDRDSAKKAFTTSNIEVSRWRYSENSPKFETDGLKNLIANMYQPWSEADRFRTELKPTKIVFDQSQIKVTVLARTFGEIRENVGLESTSMWNTRWNISVEDPESIELVDVQIVAHEELLSSSTDGVAFQDITQNVLQHNEVFWGHLNIGIDTWAQSIPRIDTTGNLGIAIGDPNGDGYEDIYLCQPAGLPNVLLSQNPDGTADNTAEAANIDLLDECRAALFVDLDNDDDEDLVISTADELLLYSNDKGRFILEHELLAGHGGGSLSAADFDNDGDLDLYICKYHSIRSELDILPNPDSYLTATSGGRNVLLRNDEGWTFVDVTDKVGLKESNLQHTRCGLWCDFDLDGDQDLILANEYSVDIIYENRNGWFSNLGKDFAALQTASATRSVSIGEFNGDGKFDFVLADNFYAESNRFSLPEERQTSPFGEIHMLAAQESRILFSSSKKEELFTQYELPKPIFYTGNAFGSVAMDLNNDGFDDLLLTNGLFSKDATPPDEQNLASAFLASAESEKTIPGVPGLNERERLEHVTRRVTDEIRKGRSFCQRQRNVCLLSMGPIGFANYSAAAGVDFPDDGRAVVATDWDHDGDLDLIMSSRTAPMLRILGNQLTTENQFVGVQLSGTVSNHDAVGARVELYLEGKNNPLVKAVTAGSGTLAQSSKRIHFGIPKDAVISGIVVHWPLGGKQSFQGIKLGTRYHIVEGQAEPAELTDTRFDIGLFEKIHPKPTRNVNASHCLLNPPMALPMLQFQSEREAWIPLRTIDEMRMAVLFVDDSDESKKLLREFADQARELAADEIDVVAIYLDADSPDQASSFEESRDLMESTEFPFRFGSASKSMMMKMELLYGEWFTDQRMPTAPFGWIVDREDQVRVVYPSEKISPERLQTALRSIGGNIGRSLDDFSLLPGHWVNPNRIGNFARLKNRFETIGANRDDNVFKELAKVSFANQLCRRAIELQAQGQGAKAREAYSTALSQDPKCELACVEFGNLRVRDSTTVKDNVERQSMLNEAELLFDRAIRMNPSNAKAFLGRAEVLEHRKKVDGAIAQLKEFLEIHPERWEVHARIGRMYFRRQEYAKSTQYLLNAWHERPTLRYLAGDLGFIYLNKGRFEDARGFFRVANQLQPSELKLKRCLAQSEFLTGNFEVAIKQLEELVELNPKEKLVKQLYAWALATSPYETQRNGKKSLQIASSMLEVFANSSVALEIAAAAHAELGDFENALLHQQNAVDLINDGITSEVYTKEQMEGLNGRLGLYKRKRPYRMSDIQQIPIPSPGVK